MAPLDAFEHHPGNGLTFQSTQEEPSVLQTIVEVARSQPESNLTSLEQEDVDGIIEATANFVLNEQASYDDSDEFELSLSDKMKNVLQELVANERVKLSFSKSITEDDDHANDDDEDERERDSSDECDGSDNVFNNNGSRRGTPAATGETNGNVAGVDNRGHEAHVPTATATDECDTTADNQHSDDQNANVGHDVALNQGEEAHAPLVRDNSSGVADEVPTDKVEAEADQEDEDSLQEALTEANSTATANESNSKSTNSNKKKKRKGKAKKK